MSQLDTIKAELNQTYDTNILRVGWMADSIWSPVGDDVESNGSHPPYRMKKNSFYRQIWDDLNYNKPISRSIIHTDWTHSGGAQENGVYPVSGNDDDPVRVLSDDVDYSIIQITGHSTLVLWFEGGELGRTFDTGTAVVEVSTNGVDYVSPSSTSLLGKKQTGRINDVLGYDSIIDELNTNVVFPTLHPPRTISGQNYMSLREIQYNNLNPSATYYFRITRKIGTNDIRLGGCYYFTGKTLIFENFSIPGADQAVLLGQYYNTLGINDMNYLLLQSTIYHDYWDDDELEYYYNKIITEAKKYCTRLVICSCTPAAVQIVNSDAEQGDEAPNYVQGQNVQKEFNNTVAFNTPDSITWANYPERDDIYRINIDAIDYDIVITTPKPSEGDFPSWPYNNIIRGRIYTAFPINDIGYPTTLSRQSGAGAASININSRFWVPRAADYTRDYVRNIANRMGVQFIDLYQVFVDLAADNGETVETDGYPVTPSSPLYSEYPTGEENYLSRYVRPNHWAPAANAPVYQKLISEVFNNFKFD